MRTAGAIEYGFLLALGIGSCSSAPLSASVSQDSIRSVVFFSENFEDPDFASRGWYDNSGLIATNSVSHSGNFSLEGHFARGARTADGGGGVRHLFQPSESVYLSYWVKYSKNWIGSGETFHPHEFYFLTNMDARYVGPAFTHLTAYVEHNYRLGGIPVLAVQDGANIDQNRVGQRLGGFVQRAIAGCNGEPDRFPTDCYRLPDGRYNNVKTWRADSIVFREAPGDYYKNDWHHVEAFFRLNSVSDSTEAADGVAQYWFDGIPVIDLRNVILRTARNAAMRFNQFMIGPWIGRGSPVDQTFWIDDLLVGDRRPVTD